MKDLVKNKYLKHESIYQFCLNTSYSNLIMPIFFFPFELTNENEGAIEQFKKI